MTMRQLATLKVAALALLLASAGCEPPHLVPMDDGPVSDAYTTVARQNGVTLIATRNDWYQSDLARVCTAVGVTIINESGQPLDVSPERFDLIDEQSRVFPALPAGEVVARLYGPGALPSETGQPMGNPPETTPSPPAVVPPAPRDSSPPAIQQPPSSTEVATPDPGFVLVAGHAVVPVGPRGGGFRASPGRPAPGGAFVVRPGYRPGRFGWGYPGWGYGYGYGWYGWYSPYPYGFWVTPGYVVGLGNPYANYSLPPGFGPDQILEMSLRSTELQNRQRMGGLVFFDPVWSSRLVTMRFTAEPREGEPTVLATRFAVAK